MITSMLRHHWPIRADVLNNHRSNLHLQFSIFMQQRGITCQLKTSGG